MGFRPKVARDLKVMDARIFSPGLMGLGPHVQGKPHRYRSARVAAWYETHRSAAQ
jgi:hypothetical protein